MPQSYSDRLERLMKSFSRLPGIGPKSSERIVLFLMKQDRAQAEELARLILDAKNNTYFCKQCNNLSARDICHICENTNRDQSVLCVVENPHDVASIEKSNVFKGLYHVLLGALSPLEGIGPRELRIDRFLERVRRQKIKEVILATNPNAEGDATALYLTEVLRPLELKVTRLARGVPVGSCIEYVDQETLQRALEGRTAV